MLHAHHITNPAHQEAEKESTAKADAKTNCPLLPSQRGRVFVQHRRRACQELLRQQRRRRCRLPHPQLGLDPCKHAAGAGPLAAIQSGRGFLLGTSGSVSKRTLRAARRSAPAARPTPAICGLWSLAIKVTLRH